MRNNVLMPEKILWKWIRNKQLGCKFRRQHSISKYIVDFYCPTLHLIIEIDGRIHDEVVSHDIVRENYLKSIGLTIKRYAAKEVNDNLEWVLTDLKECCDNLSRQRTATPL